MVCPPRQESCPLDPASVDADAPDDPRIVTFLKKGV